MNAEHYVICWHKKSEPETVHCGNPFGIDDAVFLLQDLTKSPVPYRSLDYIANAIVAKMNENYPELNHWLK
jgi:hypothetical protein